MDQRTLNPTIGIFVRREDAQRYIWSEDGHVTTEAENRVMQE